MGLLEQIKYDGADYLIERLTKVISVINHCLNKIEFPMLMEFASHKTSYLDGAVIPDINIADALINTWQYIDDKSCFEMIEIILKSFALQMRYVGGNKYQIIDVNDFRSRPITQDAIFVNGATREIVPAWKDSSIQFQYNKLENGRDRGIFRRDKGEDREEREYSDSKRLKEDMRDSGRSSEGME